MIGLIVAVMAGAGTYLVVTSLVPGLRVGTNRSRSRRTGTRHAARDWLVQAGLLDVRPLEFLAISGLLFVAAAACGFALFGGLVPALLIGGAVAVSPTSVYRARRANRAEAARYAWPRLIEEIRMRATTLGRSLPQAMAEVGERAPEELRPAFAAAQREWLLTVDFARALEVLKGQLADAAADATCETLLVAHEIGGTDLGDRLAALAQDRQADADTRKEARARQAGVRFARRFVLIVPAGMAVAGTLIGGGRAAYSTGLGQVGVLVALAMVAGCWAWAGRYLRLPTAHRVFAAAEQSTRATPLDQRRSDLDAGERELAA